MRLRITHLVVLCGLAAAPLRSQAAPAAIPASCTYAECALRFEDNRLVRGSAGQTVGTMGWFHSSAIDSLLKGPDSSAAHARRFVSDDRKSGRYWLASAAALLFFDIHAQSEHRVGGVDLAAAGLSIGLLIPAGIHRRKATTSLARSVWWYNAVLAR